MNPLRRNFRMGRIAIVRKAFPTRQGANLVRVVSQEKVQFIYQKVEFPGG